MGLTSPVLATLIQSRAQSKGSWIIRVVHSLASAHYQGFYEIGQSPALWGGTHTHYVLMWPLSLYKYRMP